MPLDEGEARIWEQSIQSLEDKDVDFSPIRLAVSSPLESVIDLFSAIEENRAKRHLSEEDSERVAGFLGDILLTENPKAILAELPYESGPDGLQLVLSFPNRGDHSG